MTTAHATNRSVETVIRAASLHLPGATPAIAAALARFTAWATCANLHALATVLESAPPALAEAAARAIGRAAMRADPAGRADIARSIHEVATTRPDHALIRHLSA